MCSAKKQHLVRGLFDSQAKAIHYMKLFIQKRSINGCIERLECFEKFYLWIWFLIDRLRVKIRSLNKPKPRRKRSSNIKEEVKETKQKD